MLAAIIGAEGKMGIWLMDHLTKVGYSVAAFDVRKGDDSRILDEVDIVIISVPVSKTRKVIRDTVKFMRRGATIVEIASLKTGIYEELVKVAEQGIDVVSLHPMFGPSVKDLKEKTVAVISVVDKLKESEFAASLFPGANIVEVDPKQHDRLMTHILSMPYLVNMALGATMGEIDLELLKKLSGTSFALQYTLIQSVAGETTSLVHALLSENHYLEDTAEEFIKNMRKLLDSTGSKDDFREKHDQIRGKMREDPCHIEASELRQAAYNAVKPLLR